MKMKINYKTRQTLWLTIVLLLIPTLSFSDGIYVTKDLKHVLSDHTTIKLSKKQIEDVERRRSVELSAEQLMPLKKLYEKIPKKLTVVSSRWDTCTCDLGAYAIWCRPGELDIPHSGILHQKDMDVNTSENDNKEKDEGYGEDEYVNESVIIDSKGQMFIAGKIFTEKMIYEVINRLSNKKVKSLKVHCSMYLDIPPPINAEVDRKIRELADRLETYSKKKGIDFWALGLSYEKLKKAN